MDQLRKSVAYHWKERREDMAQQSREFLQTFVWGGEGKFANPTIQTSVKYCDFEKLYLSYFLTNQLDNFS